MAGPFISAPVSGLTMNGAIRSPFALKMPPVALGLLVKVELLPAAGPTGGALPREEPVKASPDEVPEIDVPAVVPTEPAAPRVPGEFDVVVVVVALGGVPRAAEFIWAWAAVHAMAITTEVPRNAGVGLRIEISLGSGVRHSPRRRPLRQ